MHMTGLPTHVVLYHRSVRIHAQYCVACVLQMTGLPNHDVVFVRFQNEAISNQCLPYFIAIDEHSNSVGETLSTTNLPTSTQLHQKRALA